MTNQTLCPARRARRFAAWLGFIAAVIGVDQLTKFFFEHSFAFGSSHPVFPGFNLVLAHNTGAAFSFLADAGGWQIVFFAVLAINISVVLLTLLARHTDRPRLCLALALVTAGALGNLIDRTVYGYVVDFLDFYWQHWHWPAFNVADIAICLGAALLIVEEVFLAPKK